jgi:hypothetical protein
MVVLGDTFLRSAYVVYDLQNHEISLAATNFNATSSNILTITKESGVPDAKGVANPATPTGTVSGGGARIGGVNSDDADGAASSLGGPHNLIKAAGAGLVAFWFGALLMI